MKRTRTKTSKAAWDYVHQEINDKKYLCFNHVELGKLRCPFYTSIRTSLRELGYIDKLDKLIKPIPKSVLSDIAAMQNKKIQEAKARTKVKKEMENKNAQEVAIRMGKIHNLVLNGNPAQTKMFTDELQQVPIETLVMEIRRRGWEAKITRTTVQEL